MAVLLRAHVQAAQLDRRRREGVQREAAEGYAPRMLASDIPDTGLRLAIMDALIALGRLDEAVLRERLADIHDEEHDEDVLIAAALERLRTLDLDGGALAEIERFRDDPDGLTNKIDAEIDVFA